MPFNVFGVGTIFNPVSLLRIITLLFIVFYIIFTFIVLTQVNIMNQILNQTNASAILKTVAILNLALAVALFVASLIML